MIHAVSWSEARAKALRAESPAAGSPVERFEYFGPDGFLHARNAAQRWALHETALARAAAPHAYIVEQKPGSEIAPHFHRVPQYQITVAGSGRIGRHALGLGAIHYADEYTAYGPIVASDTGLSYCVLRSVYDPGGVYLDKPDAKQELRPSRQRYLVAGTAHNDAPAQEIVIALDDDGLGAWIFRLGAEQSLSGPDPAGGGGQYCVVLGGLVHHDGVSYDPKSVIWAAAGDRPLALRAGPEGAAFAIMQFPRVFSSRAETRNSRKDS